MQMWGFILFGFFLPVGVFVVACLYYRIPGELPRFPGHLFEAGYNYFLVMALNAIPYAVVAVPGRWLANRARNGRHAEAWYCAAVGTAIYVVLASLFLQTVGWFALVNPHHPAALAGVAFLVVPMSLVYSPLAFAIGWAVGVRRARRLPSTA